MGTLETSAWSFSEQQRPLCSVFPPGTRLSRSGPSVLRTARLAAAAELEADVLVLGARTSRPSRLPAPPGLGSLSGWFRCPRWSGSADYSSAESGRRRVRSHRLQPNVSSSRSTYFVQSRQVLVGFTHRLVFLGVLEARRGKRLMTGPAQKVLLKPNPDGYLKHHLICHREGAVQFPRQGVDLLLQVLGVRQDLEEDVSQSACPTLRPSHSPS